MGVEAILFVTIHVVIHVANVVRFAVAGSAAEDV